jgi:hypothetical protein
VEERGRRGEGACSDCLATGPVLRFFSSPRRRYPAGTRGEEEKRSFQKCLPPRRSDWETCRVAARTMHSHLLARKAICGPSGPSGLLLRRRRGRCGEPVQRVLRFFAIRNRMYSSKECCILWRDVVEARRVQSSATPPPATPPLSFGLAAGAQSSRVALVGMDVGALFRI